MPYHEKTLFAHVKIKGADPYLDSVSLLIFISGI